jgi:hypothetical protein
MALSRTSWGELRNLKGSHIQIVHFYESDADNDVLAAHDRGVVTRRQVSNDRRLSRHGRSMPAVLDFRDLVGGIIPPIIVCCQLSLEAISAPAASWSSNVGSASTLGTPYGVSSGPIARTITLFGRFLEQ